jgi:hypothetical protein
MALERPRHPADRHLARRLCCRVLPLATHYTACTCQRLCLSQPIQAFVAPHRSLDCRALMRSPHSADVRANQVSRCLWGDSALRARPARDFLILALVWWSGSFLSLASATSWRRLPWFFDRRTLPARRGASKRSRPDDHGPLQDPRGRLAGRLKAFLTRRSLRAGALTPSKTERRHRTAHKEKQQ